MPRRNRAVAGLGIVVIAVAALLPGIALLDHASFEPLWILLPDETPAASAPTCSSGDEQPVALLSVVPSRAPPALLDG